MNREMKGLHALVIGGTSGIGKATVRALTEVGCNVVATGVTKGEIEACENRPELKKVSFRLLDISDSDAVQACIGDLQRLDILVNAAGIGRGSDEFEEDGFQRTIDVNLSGTMRVCYAAKELLGRQGGSIVNLASVMSFFGTGTAPAYSASKGGVAQLTKSLAVAWAEKGIRVNAVAPGWVDTPMTLGMQEDVERNERVLARSPMGRWGKPEEIAQGIVFLSSPSASFVTGVVLPVDGGYMAVGI
jgi:2-dehydro-3-deoxy-D-gluconate 5-dehydrogenase